MRISRKGEYGVAAVLYLASQPSGKLSLSDEIAGSCGIPKNFLAQILARLRRKGILGSVRGKRGGYYLKAEPARLSLADVLEALEGPITLIRSIKEDEGKEADFLNRRVRGFFLRLQTRGYELLKSMTLADVAPAQGTDDRP
ncbi:MAG TPA: Rrf2 family transcriptional regulator [Candidatus Polarisedimenticolia bacterium]|nr:Rrf2 family transcriptional regulator [Candidatus Polarisedimenticolia bacterium]